MGIIKKKKLIDFMEKAGDGIYIIKRKDGEIVVVRKEENFTQKDIEEILKEGCNQIENKV